MANMEQLLDDVAADSANGRGSGSGGEGLILTPEDGYQKPDVQYHVFDEETLLQIEQNDRRIEGLSMSMDDEDNTYTTDWYNRLGDAIGKNLHLKALEIKGGRQCISEARDFEGFCEGLDRNRSIEVLKLSSHHCTNVDIFHNLTSFFEHNFNLRCIDVYSIENLTWSTRSLVLALSKCRKNSLRRIELEGNRMGDDASDIIKALYKQGNLEYLSLRDNEIGLRSCVALAKFLKESTVKLKELVLGDNHPYIDDECITILANSLAANKTIKSLNLGCLIEIEESHRSDHSITSEGWSSFSNILYHPMCSLQKLYLNGNKIDDEGAIAFGNALAVNKTLKYLNLGNSRSLTGKGLRAFSLCLGNPHSALEELDLNYCNIDDEGATVIANALAGNITLKSLDMSANMSITHRGWRTFFSLLLNSELSLDKLNILYNNVDDEGLAILVEVLANDANLKSLHIKWNRFITAAGLQMFPNLLLHPDCALKELYFGDNINDEVVIDFANALANNTILERLFFNWGLVTDRGWGALSTVLCDKSSIIRTYSSNHTLKEMETYFYPSSVRTFLEMNANENKAEVARQKILKHHFYDGDANIHVFTGMEMKTMPRAISWIGRDHIGFSLLYHLVLSMPALVESETKVAGGKRKYELL